MKKGKFITVSYKAYVDVDVCDICRAEADRPDLKFDDQREFDDWRRDAPHKEKWRNADWRQLDVRWDSSCICPACVKDLTETFAAKRATRESAPTQTLVPRKPKGNWDMDKYVNGDE